MSGELGLLDDGGTGGAVVHGKEGMWASTGRMRCAL